MIFQIFFPDFNFSIRRRRTNGPNFVLLPRSASPPTVEGVWAKRCGHLNILNGPDGNTERVLPTEEKRRKKRTAFIAFNACLIFLAYFWILFVFVLNSQTYVLKIYPALQTQGLNRREVVCLDTQTGTVLLVQAATAVQQRQHTHTQDYTSFRQVWNASKWNDWGFRPHSRKLAFPRHSPFSVAEAVKWMFYF